MNKLILVIISLLILESCVHEQDGKELAPVDKLIAGNKRFLEGHAIHPDESRDRISALKQAQHPFVIVVGCSDSRVPPELVFDQGLGDIFSIRTAGNVIGDYELGSIEYGVEHLGCRLVVVLGHRDCGAIKAYLSDSASSRYKDHIGSLVGYIAHEDEERSLSAGKKPDIDKAVEANVLHGVAMIKNSEPVLKEMVSKDKLSVVGAIYDLNDGKVNFFAVP
jgi:carbonic anhydrase